MSKKTLGHIGIKNLMKSNNTNLFEFYQTTVTVENEIILVPGNKVIFVLI